MPLARRTLAGLAVGGEQLVARAVGGERLERGRRQRRAAEVRVEHDAGRVDDAHESRVAAPGDALLRRREDRAGERRPLEADGTHLAREHLRAHLGEREPRLLGPLGVRGVAPIAVAARQRGSR